MAYSDEELNWVYDRRGGACFYCDKTLSFHNYGIVGAHAAWEVDHFIPLSARGAHEPSNWVAACIDCNTRKSDQMPWDFSDEFEVGDREPDNYL